MKLLPFVNFIFRGNINGSDFKIPVMGGIGFELFFLKEKWMGVTIKKLLDIKMGVFIDVGANVGQTLVCLKSVNKDIPYFGFEPNPKCYYYLDELIRRNWPNHVKVIPAGIFSFNGIASLYLNKYDDMDACASLLQKFRDLNDPQILMVPVIAGDSLDFLLREQIAIVKIDVEGAELDVIEQLSECLRKFRPFVICEILPAYSSNQMRLDRQKKIESIFKALDYRIAQIGDKLDIIEGIPIEGSEDECNFLFFPVETQSQL